MSPLNIAIIGAGPAGLTLANILLSQTTPNLINITIFESDSSASSRTTKGGTLDLHPDTGLAAIEAAGLRPVFDARARYDPRSSIMSFTNLHGTRVYDILGDVDGVNPHPEIDREVLKTLLIDALPEGTIRWGVRVTSITPDGALVFSNGSHVEEPAGKYNLVVGAEGAWSKVRAHLTNSRPVFSGIGAFELHIQDPDTTHPEVSEEVGHGLHIALGVQRILIGQRLGDGGIMVYAMAPTEGPGDSQALIDEFGDLGKVKGHLQKRYEEAGWAPTLCKWIEAADPAKIRGWPLYEYPLPDGHTYAHRPGWTLIGDAAHVMTPYAGEGVNAAMRDALELGKRIRKVVEEDSGAEELDGAVKEYEEEMFERLRPVMTKTLRNKEAAFDKYNALELLYKGMTESE